MLEFPDMLPWDEMTAMVKRHEEQITTLQREQAETRELVYCLEKQLDALQERFEYHVDFFDGYVRGVDGRMKEMEDLLVLTPEQKKMLSEAQEGDCIF